MLRALQQSMNEKILIEMDSNFRVMKLNVIGLSFSINKI